MSIELKEKALSTLAEVTKEDGTFVLDTGNNWFLRVDPLHPENSEWYTTIVQGDPDAAKKIHSAFMHQGPPYKQLVFKENDLDPETKTVGGIQPLVCVDEDGQAFVAVQYRQRHSGVVAEAFRKAWSRPEEQVKVLAEGGENKLAQIAYELSVVKGGSRLPEIDKGNWMPVEEFLMTTLEHMGKGVVAIAGLRGMFPVDKQRMDKQASRLPDFVAEWSK